MDNTNLVKLEFAEEHADSTYFTFLQHKLANANEKPVHILYYGDSQLEGDRITFTLRKAFQERYGGSGIGLIPLKHTYNSTHGFNLTVSPNWKGSVIYDRDINYKDFGLMCQYVSLGDTSSTDHKTDQAWVRIRKLKRNKGGNNDFTRLGLFYTSPDSNAVASFIFKDTVAFQFNLKHTKDIQLTKFSFQNSPQLFKMLFDTHNRLNIHGFFMEGPSGVYIDNIPLRGCVYPKLSAIDQTDLQFMLDKLNVGAVIMHFGVNLVPDIRKDYNLYTIALKREIRTIRKHLPQVPIIIVSVSDMAKKSGNNYHSYPNIPMIKEAQKEAAFATKCAFWDLEKTMGGKNSMIKWVKNTPHLGIKIISILVREELTV